MPFSYYFLVMSQKEMFQNQVLEEILRERSTYYSSQGKPHDFWILLSPNFLLPFLKKIELSSFYNQQKENIFRSESTYFAVLLTTNKDFIDWLKLRIGDFENISSINPDRKSISDGIYGEISTSQPIRSNNWRSKNDFLHPNFSQKRTQKIFENSFIE